MPFEAVIFDFDGVILDTSDQLFHGYKRVFNRYGAKYTEKDFNNIYGLKTQEHFKKVFLDNGIDLADEKINELVYERDKYYREKCSNITEPLPGVRIILKELAQNNIKLGCATSTSRENIDFFLPKLCIDHYFEYILAGTEVTKGKPNPEIYLKTCLRLKVDPINCVGIEDTEIGVGALKNANMKSIAITLTNRKEYDFSDADLIFHSLEDVKMEDLRRLF